VSQLCKQDVQTYSEFITRNLKDYELPTYICSIELKFLSKFTMFLFLLVVGFSFCNQMDPPRSRSNDQQPFVQTFPPCSIEKTMITLKRVQFPLVFSSSGKKNSRDYGVWEDSLVDAINTFKRRFTLETHFSFKVQEHELSCWPQPHDPHRSCGKK